MMKATLACLRGAQHLLPNTRPDVRPEEVCVQLMAFSGSVVLRLYSLDLGDPALFATAQSAERLGLKHQTERSGPRAHETWNHLTIEGSWLGLSRLLAEVDPEIIDWPR
jgi:hypothetical protein